jgi:hypothetical protein
MPSFVDYLAAVEFRKKYPVTCWLIDHLPAFREEFSRVDKDFEENARRNFQAERDRVGTYEHNR